ncbi:two-partner secretion domain-containing protein [Serratia ureilytica]|uniref:two-partner secretion domain-containing protein n=1 Tax=Serratia ureilytica TaxID=300181 RepID=UPI001D18170F|nr:GLUG motif-containing protein [Serratia ureilytica]MCC4107327.1 filamentous hemagglutinin N-terminal domain-containing protein [Serratia ureilytica]
MNKVYALVWNPVRECWNVVNEHCSRCGKGGSKRRLAVALSLLSLLPLEQALALPSGQNIVAGQGDITTNGQNMTVNQHSDKLITQWDNFSVGGNESVTFHQPGSNSVALNRVVGVNGSDIQGRLDANGKVFIVNPNGVIFGKNAQVNVGGLVASTRDISNADFLAGKNRFAGNSQAEIVNEGKLQAAESGSIALLGARVDNRGVIQANMGTVALGAGDDVTLNFDGNKLLNLQIDGAALDALVQNGGVLRAEGGQVLMSAKAAGDALRTVVNNQGTLEATTLRNQAGRIVLDGGDNGVVDVAGTLNASASAGNGGRIETKGARVTVQSAATVTTRATNGKTGSWQLASADVNVADNATVNAQTLSRTLENSNVELVSTKGDVAVSQQVRSQSANTLALTAERAGIKINAPISTTGGLALNHKTGYSLSKDATVTLAGKETSFSINGDQYQVVQNMGQLLGINKDLNARYVLGNSLTGNMRINAIGGDSAFNGSFEGLGNTIRGLEVTNNGAYLGLFNSSTGHISNLKLDSLTLTPTSHTQYSGALTGLNFGTVSNVQATNINIRGQGDIGGLVGINFGKVAGSSVSGNITGTASNSNLGGLVGFNLGNIQDSQTNVNVSSLPNAAFSRVGGLVGDNNGSIEDSSSEGRVIASGEQVEIGGLVGANNGKIVNAIANATVIGGHGNLIGGLAGTNYGKISNATANGPVTGTRSYAIGGLIGQNAGELDTARANGAVIDSNGRHLGGLIGVNAKNARVQNAHATNAVTGGNNANIGGLIGLNDAGKVVNASAGGKVTGGDNSHIGGLVGHNKGSLTQVKAQGDVNGSRGRDSNVGGLVGVNDVASIIDQASATGNVTGFVGSATGGLAGRNGGTIKNSSASGHVDSLGASQRGGLIGVNVGHLYGSTFNGSIAKKTMADQWVGGLIGSNFGGNVSNNTVTGTAADLPMSGRGLPNSVK